jgi:fatty acid desaturase
MYREERWSFIITMLLGGLYLVTLFSIMAFGQSPITLIIFIAFAATLLTFAVLLAIAGIIFESRHG